jgi:hypothetical protein
MISSLFVMYFSLDVIIISHLLYRVNTKSDKLITFVGLHSLKPENILLCGEFQQKSGGACAFFL